MVTKLHITKKYKVLDLKTMEIEIIQMRTDWERKNKIGVEIYSATASCHKCRIFTECIVYSKISHSGSDRVCICLNCKATRFATDKELKIYLVNKFKVVF